MEAVGGVLSAFGLAASAGLNAYVPLWLVAFVARFTDWIKLGATWEPLTRPSPARPTACSATGLRVEHEHLLARRRFGVFIKCWD